MSNQTPAFNTKYARYKDLTDAFQVTRQTIYRWSKDKTFPKPVKRGNVVLFDIAKVEAWLGESA